MDPRRVRPPAGRLPARARRQGQLYVADLFGGSQPEHRVHVRVINELAWHNLFVRTLLVRPEADELADFTPEYTIIDLPSFQRRSRAPRQPQRDRHRGQSRPRS